MTTTLKKLKELAWNLGMVDKNICPYCGDVMTKEKLSKDNRINAECEEKDRIFEYRCNNPQCEF